MALLFLQSAGGVARAQEPAAAEQIQAPEAIERPEAVYPPQALAARQEATVTLLVTIERNGSVGEVSVAQTGGELFDQAASAAVKQWRFTPAHRGAEALPSRIRIPFRFALPLVEAVPTPSSAPAAASPTPPSPPATAPAIAPPSPAPTPPPPPVPQQPTAAAPATPAAASSAAATAEESPVDVTVHGRARPPSRGTSDFQIDVAGLAAVPRQNATELLKLAPGILLTNVGGEAHAEQVFMRGFDAREGQDIEFSAGGVPVNEAGNLHGNGYADTHFVIPELVTSLHVLEGPFDPRQGNFAVAGSADYELGLAQRGITAKQTLGSFGTNRTLLLWGPDGASTGTYVGVDLYGTGGYGENRDGRRASVMLHYENHFGDSTYRVGATAYTASFHSAGVLREDDYAAHRVGFYDTYDPNQGEDASRYSLDAELESRLGKMLMRNQVFGIYRPQRLREDFTGFLLDPQLPTQDPHAQRGDGIDQENQETTLGARGSARLHDSAFGQPQELEVGYFARGDSVHSTEYRIETSTGHPYHLDTDLQSQLGDLGLYADLNLRASSWLSLRGGLRADLFTYDVLNECAVQSVAHPSRTNPPGDQSCLSQQDFGAYREPVQRVTSVGSSQTPRASLILGPFSGLGASVAYGRGVRSVDPIYISQDKKTPFASATSMEVGVAFERRIQAVELSARSTLFQTSVDHDLVFSETAGRNILGGASTRTGDASTLRLTGRYFDVASNVTYVNARFDDTHLLIPYVPDLIFRFDGSLWSDRLFPSFHPAGKAMRATLSSGVTYVAPRPLPQGERGDPVFTIDLNATLRWSAFEVGLICANLFNTQYRLGEYNYVSDFHTQPFPTLVPDRHFSAGAPRAVYATFAVHLGGES